MFLLLCRNLLMILGYISSTSTEQVTVRVIHIHHVQWRVKHIIFKN